MTYEVIIRAHAAAEILEAYDWYETKRTGLGADFLNEFEHFIAKISEDPRIFSYYEKPVRSGSLKRFPFTIAYEIDNNIIVVFSVFMTRRNPIDKRIN